MRYYVFIFVLLFQSLSLYAADKPQPRSRLLSLAPLLENEKLQLPPLDKNQMLESSKRAVSRPLQVAQPNAINQSIKDIGKWQDINGETIWLLDILAKEALHLNLGFKNG